MRSAPAENQLLCLDEELDFADAAATEFKVVTGNRHLRVTAHGMNLPFHRVDVGNRGVIEIFAPDERQTSSPSNDSPSFMSPAIGRALISAARSQFWPTTS